LSIWYSIDGGFGFAKAEVPKFFHSEGGKYKAYAAAFFPVKPVGSYQSQPIPDFNQLSAHA